MAGAMGSSRLLLTLTGLLTVLADYSLADQEFFHIPEALEVNAKLADTFPNAETVKKTRRIQSSTQSNRWGCGCEPSSSLSELPALSYAGIPAGYM